MDTLYWYYVQSKKSKDGKIISQIKDAGHKIKSRIAVIQQLLQQDIISTAEYDDLMKYEDSQYEREVKIAGSCDSLTRDESGIEVSESTDVATNPPDDIKVKFN